MQHFSFKYKEKFDEPRDFVAHNVHNPPMITVINNYTIFQNFFAATAKYLIETPNACRTNV